MTKIQNKKQKEKIKRITSTGEAIPLKTQNCFEFSYFEFVIYLRFGALNLLLNYV